MQHLFRDVVPARLILRRLDDLASHFHSGLADTLDHGRVVARGDAELRLVELLERLARRPGLAALDGQARRIVCEARVGLRRHDIVRGRVDHVGPLGIEKRDVLCVAVGIAHYVVDEEVPAKLIELRARCRRRHVGARRPYDGLG